MGSSEGDGYKLKCEKDNNVQLAALFEIENGVEDAEKGDLLVEVETYLVLGQGSSTNLFDHFLWVSGKKNYVG